MNDVLIVIQNGKATAIYDDALAEAMQGTGAELRTRRASHVEPCDGGWAADMSPMDGPKLGPFALRSGALAAERAWLDEALTR